MQEWIIQPKLHYEVRNIMQLNSSVGILLPSPLGQTGCSVFVDMGLLLQESFVLGSHPVLDVTPCTQHHCSIPDLVLQIMKITFQGRE